MGRRESVLDLEAYGDPIVAGVPCDDGNEEQQSDHSGQIRTGLTEQRTQFRMQQERGEDGDAEQHGGVLGVEGAAERDAGKAPPWERMRWVGDDRAIE